MQNESGSEPLEAIRHGRRQASEDGKPQRVKVAHAAQ
jgi:hypothetical protein